MKPVVETALSHTDRMTSLAYIDIRPLLFIGGLPFFIGLVSLTLRLAKIDFGRAKVALVSALLFTGLFTVFLTGVGPFIDQRTTREYQMTWAIKPSPLSAPSGAKQSEVILSFADFPGHDIGEYSDELAAHLRDQATQPVTVIFEVISDYGKVRGFHATEIAGLREWASEAGYARTSGSPRRSPWEGFKRSNKQLDSTRDLE